MKKTLSFIIICALLLSMSIFPTFAENSKLHPELLQVLNTKGDNDIVDICVWTNLYSPNATEMPSWPDKSAARAELKEYYTNQYNTEVVPVVFSGVEYEEVFVGSGIIIVSVKAGDVEKIASCDIVTTIDYFENGIAENEAVEYMYIDRLFEHYPDIAEAYTLNEFIYNEIGELDVDCDDAVDFVIIFAHYANVPEVFGWGAIGDRVITASGLYSPFDFGYALYDIEKDSFIEFSHTIVEDYPFLPEYMDKYKIGSPFGDADGDKILSIMDATIIQLVCAKLVQYPSTGDVYSDNVAFTSDCNRDGVLDILDATAIQLKLAGIVDEPEINEELVFSEFNNMYDVDTDIKKVTFDNLYNGHQFYAGNKISSGRFAVIIKSREQFDSVFYSDIGLEGILTDEFFNEKWIVASACMVTDEEMVAQITDLGVRNKTLFMRADKELRDSDGIGEPTAPMYHSFVAVDKDVLAQVNEIIWL